MMKNLALLLAYPSELETEIVSRKIILTSIPESFRMVELRHTPNKPIKSARALHEHMLVEAEFWTPELVCNNDIVAHYPNTLARALLIFGELIRSNVDQVKGKLDIILDLLRACPIDSATKLARTFERHQGATNHFYKGFFDAATSNRFSTCDVEWYKGFVVGMQYKSTIKEVHNVFAWKPPSRFFYENN